ncbi:MULTISPECIES: ATP-binding protein [Rheinheimera]|uniref:histidine kinase n=1 Tax=Rheinheimera marina TaxID=1774958 RepID=A0ABV9JQD1_9GAMM
MQLSLKLRQGVISLVLLLFLLPGSFFAIEQAFYTQLLSSTEQKLEVHMYSILAEVQPQGEEVALSNNLLPPDFYRPDSGLTAFITSENKLLWQSDSSINLQFEPPMHQILPASHEFVLMEQHQKKFWVLSFAVLFDSGESTLPITIHVVQDDELLQEPLQSFRSTLRQWFVGIAAVLLLLTLLAYYWTTRPLWLLDKEINKLEQGEQQQLVGDYPTELQKIKEDLNLLLSSQNRQKQRYRHHLSDLAHALKTPIAVLRTSKLSEQPELAEQLDRITAMIEHQLKRAASSGQDVWQKQIAVLPLIEKLEAALSKIYRDKGIQLDIDCQPSVSFRGDETDFMEILGNLMDNACKACHHKVKVTAFGQPLQLDVEDDGPGIPEHKMQGMFERGTRLDTYQEGHGVGLSIVAELVNSYSGALQVSRSPLGGARFVVRFSENKTRENA